MKNLLLLCMIAIIGSIVIGCSSSPNVAITQTGNPSQVSLVFAVGDTTTATSVRSALQPKTIRGDGEITSITFTSAKLIVHSVELIGDDEELLFAQSEPYTIDVAFDSTRVKIDSMNADSGTVFDSVLLNIAPIIEDGSSIVITGYTNDNTIETFEFNSSLEITKRIQLATPLVVNSATANNVKLLLDISSWFKNSDGELIDPHDTEDVQEEIEETIYESIYGDDDHEEDDDEEDETDETDKEKEEEHE